MSGQLSMDVGRWFGSGPRYVSPPAAYSLHLCEWCIMGQEEPMLSSAAQALGGKLHPLWAAVHWGQHGVTGG